MVSIYFYKPKTFYGKLIHWFNGDKITHTAIKHTMEGMDVITQAAPKQGVFISKADLQIPPDYYVDIPWISGKTSNEWLAQRWGIDYSLLDILNIAARLKPFNNRNFSGYICSELVAEFMENAYRLEPRTADWDEFFRNLKKYPNTAKITPQQLFDCFGNKIKEFR